MKLRIVIWAGMGALIVVLWSVYISGAPPTSWEVMWALDVTCPIALARHHALNFDFVALMNAATYALVGAVVETARRHYKSSLTT